MVYILPVIEGWKMVEMVPVLTGCVMVYLQLEYLMLTVQSRNVSVYIQEQTQHVFQTHTYMDNGQTSVRADSHTVVQHCPTVPMRGATSLPLVSSMGIADRALAWPPRSSPATFYFCFRHRCYRPTAGAI